MKKFGFLALVVILGVLAYVYYMYNKPHKDVGSSKAQIELTATELMGKFTQAEDEAIATLVDQVILLKGEIDHIDLSNENEPQVVLKTSDTEGFVRCGFSPELKADIEKLKASSPLSVKGICKGMNANDELDLLSDTEIILSKCIIIANE